MERRKNEMRQNNTEKHIQKFSPFPLSFLFFIFFANSILLVLVWQKFIFYLKLSVVSNEEWQNKLFGFSAEQIQKVFLGFFARKKYRIEFQQKEVWNFQMQTANLCTSSAFPDYLTQLRDFF